MCQMARCLCSSLHIEVVNDDLTMIRHCMESICKHRIAQCSNHGDGLAPSAHTGENKENSSRGGWHPASQQDDPDKEQRSQGDAETAAAPDAGKSRGVWGRGRVTLVGDAAHATINNGN